MPEDPCQLSLWKALEKGTDQQRTMVRDLLGYAGPMLDRVIETFPTYTLHNAQHARNVAENMAGLLGEHVADLLPVEAALLILAAYFHDIGMVFTEEERSHLTAEPEWNDFLEKTPEAFLAYARAGDGPLPLDLAEWYCRWRHADRVYVHLRRLAPDRLKWGAVPLFEILGELCRSHDKPVSTMLANPKLKVDGLHDADLRFCAVLLRLGDILDFDGSRSPDAVYRHLGLRQRDTARMERSDVEWRKHLSSDGIRFPKERGKRYELRFSAGPDDPNVEHDVREFLTVIEQELEQCAAVLPNCSDRWRNLDLPASVDRDNIISDRYLYGEYRFTLDQDHVLRLLMGENLYASPYVFVREVLQNAIDASRLREHLEHASGNLTFKAPPIRVSEWTDPDHNRWVRFDDEGAGMDERIIRQHLLRVGSSYYTSSQFKADMLRADQGGSGFVPISRFGIGLLSCFIACDRIEISTLRRPLPGDKAKPIRLSLDGLQGFFVLSMGPLQASPMPNDGRLTGAHASYRVTPGTSIACRLDPTKEREAFELSKALKMHVVAPPVPIEFEGECIGGDLAALSNSDWIAPTYQGLESDDVAAMTEKIGLPFSASTVSVMIAEVNLDRFSPTPDLRGRLIWASPIVNDDMGGLLGVDDSRAVRLTLRVQGRLGAGGIVPGDVEPFSFQLTAHRNPYIDLGSLRPDLAQLLAADKRVGQAVFEATHTATLAKPVILNSDFADLLRQHGRQTLISYNGINVTEKHGAALTLPAGGVAWTTLFLADRLGPAFTISRELRGLPWEIHSAFGLTLRRALVREGAQEPILANLNALNMYIHGDYLSLTRLFKDPLIDGAGHWRSEAIFPLVSENAMTLTLSETLDRVARGHDTYLQLQPNLAHPHKFFVSPGAPQILAAAALADHLLDLELVPENSFTNPWYRVKGPRTALMSPGKRLFKPLAFLPYYDSDLLRVGPPCLNTKHPFALWLQEHAVPLSRGFPGIFAAIRENLIEHIQFNPQSAVDILTRVLDRLGRIAPELSPARAIYPKLSDFPPDA